MVGLVKSLPVSEMEKLILANSTVDEEDLIDLGDRRAKAVRDWLIEHEVPVDRIFLRPTQLGTGEAKPGAETETKAKAARADFSLK
jgi:outer membrane protein OmpA-like peptidoglycan-associated protein